MSDLSGYTNEDLQRYCAAMEGFYHQLASTFEQIKIMEKQFSFVGNPMTEQQKTAFRQRAVQFYNTQMPNLSDYKRG